MLVVPVGSGSAASSLDNSFARIDVAELLARAGEDLVAALEDPRPRLRRAAGRAGAGPLAGRWRPGLVTSRPSSPIRPGTPSAGRCGWSVSCRTSAGRELVERLARNARCVRAISRPSRAVASVADRLTAAELQEGEAATDRPLPLRPRVDLSDATGVGSRLAGHLPTRRDADVRALAARRAAHRSRSRASAHRPVPQGGRHAARRQPG